ncbi:MAG: serine kinase [Anaerolineae bacterium]|jgi:predicted transcriptional regulator|nr:serine kinase [Anaerolineae bacterium]
MKVRDVVEQLGWRVLGGAGGLDAEVNGGYVADLLSCVMAGAEAGDLWLTLQTHANIVAVASLLGVCAIVVAEGANVPEGTLEKAEEQGMPVLSSPDPVYESVAQLISLGV